MFAVKGWSVDSASLKPQTEVFASRKSGDGDSKKPSKKRKRAHAEEAKQDSDDVGRLWEKYIEGRDSPKKEKKEKEHKKRKQDPVGEEPEQPNQLLNAADKPKRKKDIERWEDIDLDPHKDRRKSFQKAKKKQEAREAREQDRLVKEAVESESANGSKGPEQNGVAEQTAVLPELAKLTPMQSAMRQKLISARFRHLNETLYTEPSSKAQELFNQNPEMFEDYHAGFRQQVSVWPENPLDKFISEIRRRGILKPPKVQKKRKVNATIRRPPESAYWDILPRTSGMSVIADLGCGDGRLARIMANSGIEKKLNLKLHSFDLHSPSPLVAKADISDLPLKDDSVDVAILCLALMGTNWISFIEEAHRVLHWKGELWVAEIKSRFSRVSKAGKAVNHSVGSKRKQAMLKDAKDAKKREQDEVDEQEVLQTEVDGVSSGKEETDVSAFVDVLKRRGFILKPPGERHVDLQNKMFVKMEFVKALTPVKGKGVPKDDSKGPMKAKPKFLPDLDKDVPTEDETTTLKPCLYKLR